MIRRDAWQQVGGMREQFGLLADIDLWMRLAMRWAVGYVPDPVITIRQQRPGYYPDIYKYESWSWQRQRYLYEIHAINRIEYIDRGTVLGRLRWWGFRLRLNLETAKWLTYAVVRKRWSMIESSRQSETTYDFWFLHLYRYVLHKVSERLVRRAQQ